MQIHVTDEAVMITELSDEDMQHLLHLLRGTAGRSLVIPRKPSLHGPLGDAEQLAALISSLRGSAQEHSPRSSGGASASLATTASSSGGAR